VLAELERHLQQLEMVKSDGRAVVTGLSDTQLNWRPEPGRWSVAECLAHLNQSLSKVLPAIDNAIDSGRSRGLLASGPFRYGLFARLMVASMEPPPRYRMRSPKIFRLAPAEYRSASLLPQFLAVRDRLAERVRASDGLNLKRVIVTSPASRFFRMPLGAYLAFLLAHERRHVWQAREVRKAGDAVGWRRADA
jgi:hypothetical protein